MSEGNNSGTLWIVPTTNLSLSSNVEWSEWREEEREQYRRIIRHVNWVMRSRWAGGGGDWRAVHVMEN